MSYFSQKYGKFWLFFGVIFNVCIICQQFCLKNMLILLTYFNEGFYYMKCGKFTQVRLYPYFTCGYGRRSLSSSCSTLQYISNHSIPSICVVLKKFPSTDGSVTFFSESCWIWDEVNFLLGIFSPFFHTVWWFFYEKLVSKLVKLTREKIYFGYSKLKKPDPSLHLHTVRICKCV